MTPSIDELAGLTEVVTTSRYPRVAVPAAPAAGADWSLTVPGGFRWRLVSLVGRLVTSATVANRYPTLTLSDGTTVFARVPAITAAVASGTSFYWWAIGGGSYVPSTLTTPQSLWLPDMWLESGYVVNANTSALDATDQWSQVAAYVVESRTGPPAPREVRAALDTDSVD